MSYNMNTETPELRYTPLPETIPFDSPFSLDKSPVLRGYKFNEVSDALFTSGIQYCEAELYHLLEPFKSGDRNDHTLLFRPEASYGEMFWLWKSLAYAVMTAGEKDGVSWKIRRFGRTPIISRMFLEKGLKKYLLSSGNLTKGSQTDKKIETLMNICDRGIEEFYWPISKKKEEYIFNEDMVFYLAASNFLINHDYTADIASLKKEGLLNKNKFSHYGPFYSFLAELIFDYADAKKFQEFILGLSDVFGGDLGLAIAVCEIKSLRIREDRKEIKIPQDEGKKILLDNVEAILQENYLYQKYIERPVIINENTIKEIQVADAADLSNFWQEIFEKEGVKEAMKDLFGENIDLRPVYETALSERKVIPASLMMIAEALGLDREEAQILAALSQFSWGMIVSYDNVVDGHKFRKGKATQVANDGVPIALDITMLSLAGILKRTLHNSELVENFLEMLNFSCKGDLISRRLDWDDSTDLYEESMAGLTKAFSWFPQYIGNRVGLVEAGQNFAAFLADLHSLGQLNNDIEDIDPPPMKHEEGNDVGKRITLFWKILMDLPNSQVLEHEEQLIRRVFAYKNGSEEAAKEDIAKVLAIGKRCKAEVLARMEQIVQWVYKEAGRHLELAFDSLPVMDQRNQTYKNIFANTLEIVRRNFLS